MSFHYIKTDAERYRSCDGCLDMAVTCRICDGTGRVLIDPDAKPEIEILWDSGHDVDGTRSNPRGWYWLRLTLSSDPRGIRNGPFDTKAEALTAARKSPS